MPTHQYATFDVLVEPAFDRPGGYQARVLDSPAGQSTTPLTALDPNELASFLTRVGGRGPLVGGTLKLEDLIKQFGGRMFDAVFQGETLTAYRRSRDLAARDGKGLRIRLRLADAPALADVPWEYMYDTTRQNFLALARETPIVRFLALPEPVAPLTAPAPLNVLVLLASPTDYDELDIESEWQGLQAALDPLVQKNLVTLTRVTPPTVDALRALLRQNAYHVFHFIGHGAYEPDNQAGLLVLADENNKGRRVNDQLLAALLRNARTLRLVLLNSCDGGRTAKTNPFAGVAPRLVQQDIPAVAAMQFRISDPAAISFSVEFYRTLADRFPVDAAVNEARLAIYSSGNFMEWGTPILFMRSDDGMLFGERDTVTQKTSSSSQADAPAPPRHGRAGDANPSDTGSRWRPPSSGINISGSAQVSAGRDIIGGDKIVQGDDYDVEGDMNVVTIGAGAQVGQVAAGRGIQQTSGSAAEQNDLAAKLVEAQRALQAARAQVDPNKLALADFQWQLLQTELTRTDGAPSGATLTAAADGLLAIVPALREPLGALLKSPAAQRILNAAGAADWLRKRFG